MSTAPVIQATELSRWYGIVMGLNNISFEIGPGLTPFTRTFGASSAANDFVRLITPAFAAA